MISQGTHPIETSRLLLRKFKLSDAEGVFTGFASNDRVTTYVSWSAYKNIEETKEHIKKWIEKYNDDNTYHWVVEIKSTHEIIGRISVVPKINDNYCEVRYCYGEKYWNCGYATEALIAVNDYLLNECKFHVVEAKYSSKNSASGKVMEKAGMIKEAVLKDRVYNHKLNQYDDLVYYYKMI